MTLFSRFIWGATLRVEDSVRGEQPYFNLTDCPLFVSNQKAIFGNLDTTQKCLFATFKLWRLRFMRSAKT